MFGVGEFLKEEGFEEPELLGDGSSATVLVAYSKAEEKDVALKVLPIHSEEFEIENRVLDKVANKRVIKQYRTVIGPKYAIIVLEMMDHDLMDTIEAVGKLKETKARTIFYEVCRAVLYCHSKHIAHLDIKPENILLDDTETNVVLTDFGTSQHYKVNTPSILTPVGTFFYCAPEVSKKLLCYPDKADVWSLGILLHVLLTGTWPYAGSTYDEACDNAAKGQIHCLEDKLSPNAYNLINHMLVTDPEERYNIIEVLDHPFFKLVERRESEMEHKMNFGLESPREDLDDEIIEMNRPRSSSKPAFTTYTTPGSSRTLHVNQDSSLSKRITNLNEGGGLSLKLNTLDKMDGESPREVKGLKTPRESSSITPRVAQIKKEKLTSSTDKLSLPNDPRKAHKRTSSSSGPLTSFFKKVREVASKVR